MGDAQGKAPLGEVSLAELLTIDALRRLEKDEPRFVPSVDIACAEHHALQDKSDPDAAARALADRADDILRSEYGLGRSTIAEAMKWLSRIRVVCVAVVAASAVGICGRVLLAREADQTVSVGGFVWFLALDIMMAVPPVLLMLAGSMKLAGRGDPRSGPPSFIAEILEDLGKVLTAFYWVFLAGMNVIQKLLLSRAFPNAHSSEKVERYGKAVGALAGGQSHLLLKAVAMTSHLCWTIVCSVVLLCFFASTTFRDYDFQWHSTWLDQSGKLRWLECCATPIRWLPPTPSPDENLVAYLSADSANRRVESPIPLSSLIVDRVRNAENSKERVHSCCDRVRSAEDHGKGVGKQRQEGFAAAQEHLHRLDTLVESIREDPNAIQLLGSQGLETLNDLVGRLRDLRASAEKRKIGAEALFFEEAENERGATPQSATYHINRAQQALGTALSDINRKQQAAAQAASLYSTARASSAHLMAAFLLYYGILPRLILFVIAKIQLARSLRTLRPSLTSPYIAKVIENLTRPPMGPSAFGEVKDFPGTTRMVSGVRFKVESEAKTYMIVFDTPGFQNSAEAIESCGEQFTVDDVHRFFRNRQEFSDDAKALEQVRASQVVLYVVDSTCGPTENLKSDLRILARSGVPVIPLFNFVKDDQSPERKAWTDFLRHIGYFLHVVYDAHFYRPDEERDLYDKVRVHLNDPLHREFFDYHVRTRQYEEKRMARQAIALMAEMLLDCSAYWHRSNRVEAQERQPTADDATDTFKKKIAERESEAMKAMVAAFGFGKGLLERTTDGTETAALWKEDLWGAAIAKYLGIGAAGGLASGGAIGAVADAVLAGHSLGAGTLIGAVIGAIVGVCGSGLCCAKWDRKRSTLVIQCTEKARKALIERSLLLLKNLQHRGMADQRDFVVTDKAMRDAEEGFNKRLLVALQGAKADVAKLLDELTDDARDGRLSMIGVDPQSVAKQVKAQRKDALARIEQLTAVLVEKLEG